MQERRAQPRGVQGVGVLKALDQRSVSQNRLDRSSDIDQDSGSEVSLVWSATRTMGRPRYSRPTCKS